MFIVDGSWQPAPQALAILADVADGHFTTEVGAFNLELNLDPQVFSGTCLSTMEAQLNELLSVVRAVAAAPGLNIVITGILPTIRKGDLSLDNMVQNPRYLALNDALMSLRGEAYELHIKGMDELRVRQDSVMAEACNASSKFICRSAQTSSSTCTTSPSYWPGLSSRAQRTHRAFGKRLWAETRIALFEQSVDTRRPGHQTATAVPASRSAPTGSTSRSPSCTRRTSPASDPYFRRTLMRIRSPNWPRVGYRASPPCSMHTGTVWRWNRGCYGITDGVPHLRIENRVLPSGQSVADEIANVRDVARIDESRQRPSSRGQPDDAVRGGPGELRVCGPSGPGVTQMSIDGE